MSDERAERLRVATMAGMAQCSPGVDWVAEEAEHVLRAIVTELGITREMVAHYVTDPCPTCAKTRDAFATLLDAAGVP